QAEILRETPLCAPARCKERVQQRDAGQPLPARHARESFDAGAEIAPAERPVRSVEVLLDLFRLAQQELVAVAAGEELIGSFTGERHDEPVAARLARQTEERKHAEAADRKLDVARQIGKGLEKVLAGGRHDARLEAELTRELEYVVAFVDGVLELREL